MRCVVFYCRVASRIRPRILRTAHYNRVYKRDLHSFALKGQLSNSENFALLTFLHEYNQTCVAR